MKLSIQIVYCSNEHTYIDDILRAASRAADVVTVAVGRRLFDGRVESEDHINAIAARHPTVRFGWYDVPDALIPTPIVLHNRARRLARNLAVQALATITGEAEPDYWAILLDADEVPRDNGSPLVAWWRASDYGHLLEKERVYKLANRWFFMHRRLVSDGFEDSVVLAHSSLLTHAALDHPRERDGVCFCAEDACPSKPTVRDVRGLDSQPMFDHFSWVRSSRDLLLAKVKTWGHKNDRDWSSLVNNVSDDIERGVFPTRDFVHGRKLILLDE